MAEVVGVISGAVTIGALAANIAMSVAKLRTYWNRLENAPADIRRLMDEVEILSLILDEIKDDQARNPISSLLLDNSSLSRCLDHCQRAAERLSLLTEEMEKSLETSGRLKKRWLSAKVMLKKDKVESFKLELESAIRLLSLSHQSYTRALISLQPDIIFGRVSQAISPGTLSTTIAVDDNESNSSSLTSQNLRTSSKYTILKSSRSDCSWQTTPVLGVFGSLSCVIKEFAGKKHPGRKDRDDNKYLQIVASYRGPAWLVNRTWNFHATRSCRGWDFSIRHFNIVPHDSLIFRYAVVGNVTRLQRLFDERQASPFDCNEFGWTALHFAAARSRYSTCKLLIELGSDVNICIGDSCTPFNFAITVMFYLCQPDRIQEARDTSRLLLLEGEIDSDYIKGYSGSEEGFVLWQQKLYPDYYEAPLNERVNLALQLACNKVSPAVFRRALCQGEIPSSAINFRGKWGMTLLHGIAESIGESVETKWHDSQETDVWVNDWQVHLREIVNKGGDIHAVAHGSRTPLLSLIFRFFSEECDLWSPLWSLTLCGWLDILMECGVDLHDYGRRENELHENGVSVWNFGIWVHRDSSTLKFQNHHITTFTYGSSPDDWQIILGLHDEEIDEDLDQMEAMPGGWIEE